MHLEGTDLDLKGLAVCADQRRMQRLVHIRLRHRDIIFKTAGDRFVHLVDHTQSRVTVFYGVHDDADREDIVDLVQRLVLV